jgi:tRNA-dihydrouridine synthase
MKLWLAPLHGITWHHFRNCLVKYFHEIDYAITPFVAAQSKEKLNPKKLRDLFPKNNTALPIIPQLMGNTPEDIKDTILVLNEYFGYQQFNWNIGCPANQIVRKKRGCGVMQYPDLIENTVNEVCGKTVARFSLKMRLGLHATSEGLVILERLAPYPIDFLCIHPRLGIQQYEGSVDLDTFEHFYHSTNHTIVYSGDINNVDFFIKLQQRFPKIENWLLGRGILQNPFLAEEITNFAMDGLQHKVNANMSKRFINFYHDYSKTILTLFGEKTTLSALKELWHYFSVFFKLTSSELINLLQINDYHEFQKAATKITTKKI